MQIENIVRKLNLGKENLYILEFCCDTSMQRKSVLSFKKKVHRSKITHPKGYGPRPCVLLVD